MRTGFLAICILGMSAVVSHGETAKRTPKPQDGQSIVIVFKDGRQQTFPMAEVARIEFQGSASPALSNTGEFPGRGRFLGKWEVGEGNGDNFYITLEANGRAVRSLHETRGTWTVVNGMACVTWEDRSYDAIRKVGDKYEKVWYPDETFSGKPNNVTNARLIESKPI